MDFSSFPPEFVQQMSELMASGKLQLPPPIFTDMGGEFVALDMAAKRLTVRFPVQARSVNVLLQKKRP